MLSKLLRRPKQPGTGSAARRDPLLAALAERHGLHRRTRDLLAEVAAISGVAPGELFLSTERFDRLVAAATRSNRQVAARAAVLQVVRHDLFG